MWRDWSTLKKLLFLAAMQRKKQQTTPSEGEKPDSLGNNRGKRENANREEEKGN